MIQAWFLFDERLEIGFEQLYSYVRYLFHDLTHCAFFKFYYRLRSSCITDYKLGRLFSLTARTVRHFFLLPSRLPATCCFLSRLRSIINGFLPRLREAGSRITHAHRLGKKPFLAQAGLGWKQKVAHRFDESYV